MAGGLRYVKHCKSETNKLVSSLELDLQVKEREVAGIRVANEELQKDANSLQRYRKESIQLRTRLCQAEKEITALAEDSRETKRKLEQLPRENRALRAEQTRWIQNSIRMADLETRTTELSRVKGACARAEEELTKQRRAIKKTIKLEQELITVKDRRAETETSLEDAKTAIVDLKERFANRAQGSETITR